MSYLHIVTTLVTFEQTRIYRIYYESWWRQKEGILYYMCIYIVVSWDLCCTIIVNRDLSSSVHKLSIENMREYSYFSARHHKLTLSNKYKKCDIPIHFLFKHVDFSADKMCHMHISSWHYKIISVIKLHEWCIYIFKIHLKGEVQCGIYVTWNN